MDLKMHLCIYVFMLVNVMDAIEGLDNEYAHGMRPEDNNAYIFKLEPEQKHDMHVEMNRLGPNEDNSKTNSNSGKVDNEQINWLTQVKQYVNKLVMIPNWIAPKNVIYHVTKVVNVWNYNPLTTVVKFFIDSDVSNAMNASEYNNKDSEEALNSGWEGIANDLVEENPEAKQVAGNADNAIEKNIGGAGMKMRRLISPAIVQSRKERSLLTKGGLLDTEGLLNIGGLLGTAEDLIGGVIGTVLGTGRKGAGTGGRGTLADGKVDVETRHKRSLILI